MKNLISDHERRKTNKPTSNISWRLYINNELYVVPRTGVIPTDEDYENTTPIRYAYGSGTPSDFTESIS